MAIRNIKGNLDRTVGTVSRKAKKVGGVAAVNAKKVGEAAAVNAKKVGEAAAANTKEGLKAASRKAHEAQHELRMKKYNPLFPEEFEAEDFDCPKIIVIEDEDTRKNIDVCAGAIGWLSKDAGSEVLHLYEEYVPKSGLTFFPRIACESIYYMNPNQDDRYINLNCYFDTMMQDKLSELKNIAYCLGAKECQLESYEYKNEVKTRHASASRHLSSGPVFNAAQSIDGDTTQKTTSERQIVFNQVFEGSDNPIMPTLDWYAGDREINNLIAMRMAGSHNQTKEYSVTIDSSTSQSMDINLAVKLDAAVKKISSNAKGSLSRESAKEMNTKLVFIVKF